MSSRESGREYKEARLRQSAEEILSTVGLRFQDLEKFKQPGSVVDLGCGEGDVGRAANLQGLDSVISIANRKPVDISGLDFRLMDAHNEILLPESSVKILFSRNGPHLWTYNEAQARQLFENINRVLAKDGEARFHVPWLGYIQMQIAKEMSTGPNSQKTQGVWRRLQSHPTDWQASSGGLLGSTQKKLADAKPYLVDAMNRSSEFLRSLGYDLSLTSAQDAGEIEQMIWVMKKSKISV
jgi:SAM-dependent methyltransferase